MAERALRIIHGPNPLFGECVRCGERFTSFAAIPAEAQRQVQVAFMEHKCKKEKTETPKK
jgi:hypothetical protein